MGTLAMRIRHIDTVSNAIKAALAHFAERSLPEKTETRLALAADLAFSDELLFEKFQMWTQERDDEVFLFHIDRFFEKRGQTALAPAERDLTPRRAFVEAAVAKSVRDRQKQIFGQRITILAAERGLLTNDQLGDFLGVSGEQARKFKAGENKPQLATLKNIADRFKVPVGFLIGLSEES